MQQLTEYAILELNRLLIPVKTLVPEYETLLAEENDDAAISKLRELRPAVDDLVNAIRNLCNLGYTVEFRFSSGNRIIAIAGFLQNTDILLYAEEPDAMITAKGIRLSRIDAFTEVHIGSKP